MVATTLQGETKRELSACSNARAEIPEYPGHSHHASQENLAETLRGLGFRFVHRMMVAQPMELQFLFFPFMRRAFCDHEPRADRIVVGRNAIVGQAQLVREIAGGS